MAYIQTSGGGRSIQRIVNPVVFPAAAPLASKTSGWTPDNFTTGSLEVDFLPYIPIGTVAVWAGVQQSATFGNVFYRPKGDTNIDNAPEAEGDYAALILTGQNGMYIGWLFLSSDGKIQITVGDGLTDITVYQPSAVLI